MKDEILLHALLVHCVDIGIRSEDQSNHARENWKLCAKICMGNHIGIIRLVKKKKTLQNTSQTRIGYHRTSPLQSQYNHTSITLISRQPKAKSPHQEGGSKFHKTAL